MTLSHNPNPIGAAIEIALVGDVHDQWTAGDATALQGMGVDLVLFVGDFGNEAVEVVRAIAALPLPKAVILGNHDAWYTASAWGRKRSPYDPAREDRVRQQLDLLGTCHVGYGAIEFPALGLAVVGGRPFSWGGLEWKNAEFYRDRYGIADFASSTARIVARARTVSSNTIVFLAHNGPYGLGDRAHSPCGCDWQLEGGDYGDPDLTEAIAQVRQLPKRIPLVAFGHMHHRLRHGGQRTPLAADANGTIYLNVACVPRLAASDRGPLHNFTRVTLVAGEVTRVAIVWTTDDGEIADEQLLSLPPIRAIAG